jgi:ribosomal protein S18 acetylase RimI-like enzyme
VSGADGARIDALTDVIVRAFATDPSVPLAFPDPETRERACRSAYRIFVTIALSYGEVLTAGEPVRAVALWTPPDPPAVPDEAYAAAGFGELRAMLSEESRAAMNAFVGVVNTMHERITDGPHWHLDFLATHPDHQGEGLGSSLLAPIHERADRDGLPCALETTTESNVRFYERRGYEVVDVMPVGDAGDRLWGMRRLPGAVDPSR